MLKQKLAKEYDDGILPTVREKSSRKLRSASNGESEVGLGWLEHDGRRPLRPEPAPRGLNREMAARYVGLSPSKFDQLVIDGRMPKAKRIDGRRVWDRWRVDLAFDAIGDDNHINPWD